MDTPHMYLVCGTPLRTRKASRNASRLPRRTLVSLAVALASAPAACTGSGHSARHRVVRRLTLLFAAVWVSERVSTPRNLRQQIATSHQSSMRVVCVSDTHGLHDEALAIPAGDVLVHAGDFTDTGERDEVRIRSIAVKDLGGVS